MLLSHRSTRWPKIEGSRTSPSVTRIRRQLSLVYMFSTCGILGVLFCEGADDSSGDFMVENGLVVLADDVDAKFLVEVSER